jgi:Na+-transporting methylmalonyl-CoA/oxaloacetate decarboxylase gamma subunit
MSEILWQGIWISIVGLGILFGAMGLLIVVMMLLERLSPGQPHGLPEAETIEDSDRTDREEVAAAIAVALAHLRAQAFSQDNLGSTLDAGPGQWWLAGRGGQSPTPPRPTARWSADP